MGSAITEAIFANGHARFRNLARAESRDLGGFGNALHQYRIPFDALVSEESGYEAGTPDVQSS